MMVRVIQRQWVVLEEREGGLPPGSPEACAAIERVRRMLNPDAAQPKTQPAWSIKEPDSPEFRKCARCGAAVRGKRLCKPCQADVRDEEQMPFRTQEERSEPNRQRGRRRLSHCLTCNAPINQNGTFHERCEPCRVKAHQDAKRAYHLRAQESRICITCKVSIAGLPEKRVRCEWCQTEKNEAESRRRAGLPRIKPPRTCQDCGADITERHGATIRCFRCANTHINQSRTKKRNTPQGQVSA